MEHETLSVRLAQPLNAVWPNAASIRLAMGDLVSFGDSPGALWRVDAIDPPRFARMGAPAGVAPPAPCLRFQVSQDEGRHALVVDGGERLPHDLGVRVHHQVLLMLARRRLRDARRGCDDTAQGWIDAAALAQMLGLDPCHLNLQLHRARTQLAAAGVRHLVERRRGELRLARFAFTIVRGEVLEGSYRPPIRYCATPLPPH